MTPDFIGVLINAHLHFIPPSVTMDSLHMIRRKLVPQVPKGSPELTGFPKGPEGFPGPVEHRAIEVTNCILKLVLSMRWRHQPLE